MIGFAQKYNFVDPKIASNEFAITSQTHFEANGIKLYPTDSHDLVYNWKGELQYKKWFVWDFNNKKWKNYRIQNYSYYLNGKLSLMVDTFFPANSVGDLTEYSYDGNQRLYMKVSKDWDNSSSKWVNYDRVTYSYTGFDSVESVLTERWDDANSKWRNEIRIDYVFTPDKLDSIKTFNVWDIAKNEWYPSQRLIYVRNAARKLVSHTNQGWSTFSKSYYNSYKYEFSYDANNRLATKALRDGTKDPNVWNNKFLITYAYDANGNLENILEEEWLLSLEWDIKKLTTFTYNAKNQKTSEILQTRDGGKWVNYSKFSFEYNADGLLIGYYDAYFSTDWIVYKGYNNWYGPKTTGISNTKSSHALTLYPNPTKGVCTIKLPANFIKGSLLVRDVAGRIVQQKELSHANETELNIQSPKGMYFVELQSNQEVFTARVLVD